ncbi:MAG: glycosyltransferase family 2 protein [Planctomycetota bacterium]|nr:glycosyltransferase family 2 protein [Planctomycetota bacterium]
MSTVDDTLHSSVPLSDPAVDATQSTEVSVVMPCLDEADTLATCIQKARAAMEAHGIRGEIVVADNGSTDGSIDIAEQIGARVVHVAESGYGAALRGGIEASRGRYVVMGDADDSYDFGEIPRFVKLLRDGFDLVQGCRLPRGGGVIVRGAMPWLHERIGNPMFSFLVRRMFKAPINDVYCGLRGFSRAAYDELDLRCSGMEFATEMVIKNSLFKKSIAEISITLHPDGRVAHRPHLRTFRDGWRTLRFFLLYSPRWLFLVPGLFLVLLGILGYALAMPGITIWGATLDAHTLLFSSLAILLGYQAVQFAVFAKTFAVAEGLLPRDSRLDMLLSVATVERGLVAGAIGFITGCILLGLAVNEWRLVSFGALDYARTMRLVIPGVMLSALGCQTVLSGFFVSILGMARKAR